MPRRTTKTELPRGYISWSQIDLVERDPYEYVERYIYGKESIDTEHTRFGTEMHKRFSNGKPDVRIECELTRKARALKLIGYLDAQEGDKQIEYKTSTKLWTAHKAREHGQLKVYALIHYKNTGVIPDQELRCYETADIGGLTLTGEHRIFPIRYTVKDMLEIEARIWRAHDKIIALVEKELSETF